MVRDEKDPIRDDEYAIFIDDRSAVNAGPNRPRLSDEEMDDFLADLADECPDLFSSRKRK